jgi:hypothetical protein
VVLGRLDGWLAMIAAYAPLVWVAFRLKAGAAELQRETADASPTP